MMFTIKVLSSGNTQYFPDISIDNFLNDYSKRIGLMEYKGEKYWRVDNTTMFVSNKTNYYYKTNKNETMAVVGYDLAKLIDFVCDV